MFWLPAACQCWSIGDIPETFTEGFEMINMYESLMTLTRHNSVS